MDKTDEQGHGGSVVPITIKTDGPSPDFGEDIRGAYEIVLAIGQGRLSDPIERCGYKLRMAKRLGFVSGTGLIQVGDEDVPHPVPSLTCEGVDRFEALIEAGA